MELSPATAPLSPFAAVTPAAGDGLTARVLTGPDAPLASAVPALWSNGGAQPLSQVNAGVAELTPRGRMLTTQYRAAEFMSEHLPDDVTRAAHAKLAANRPGRAE